jgi:GNAT superfamily N-acetyltransferase
VPFSMRLCSITFHKLGIGKTNLAHRFYYSSPNRIMTTTAASADDICVTLRPVTPEDDEFLLKVYESTRAEELAQVTWEPGKREAFVRWQFDMQRQEYDARYPNARYSVVMVNGIPAGRIWVGEDDTQIRLLDIGLLPEFQNRGAGTVLLKQLIEEAASANKPLRHMVFVLNNNAHRFYEELGFVTFEDLGGYKHMEWRGNDKSAGE